jgi:hypothetical protein
MNGIIRTESTADVFGIPGRRFAVVAADNGRVLNQKIGASVSDGAGGIVSVSMRFDDQCNNGHETFSITGTYRTADDIKRRREGCGGCIHEEIARFFPSLAHLIRWHLVSTDGPMHYPGNVLFLAGVRDCWGLLKGQVRNTKKHVWFGDFHISFKVADKFAEWMELHRTGRVQAWRCEHPREPEKFAPMWTLTGYAVPWHKCPFNTEREAEQFARAMSTYQDWKIEDVPCAWGDGKARELAGARSCACWPEATDDQLSADTDELRAVLMARLPALMADFRADMEAAGFLWPVRTDAAVTL